MFDLHSITLFNFRSFKGKHKFEFPTEFGLYNLTGRNLDNPRLGSNGCGKSTLLDAIYWCIYGRTTRGLKAGDVITWDELLGSGKKTCSVTLTLTVGGQTSVIKRKQSPNALTLDGEPVEQEAVNKFIRLTADAFTYGVMIPQFGTSFFDMSAGAKLALFSGILELDYWLERSKVAATLTSELGADHITVSTELTRCRTRIESSEGTRADLKAEHANFSNTSNTEIKGLKDKKASAQQGLVSLDDRIRIAAGSLQTADAKLKTAEKVVAEHRVKIDALKAEKNDAVAVHAGAKNALAGLRVSLRAVSGLEGRATCPTCRQVVGATHLKAQKHHLKIEVAKAEVTEGGRFCDIKDIDEEINEANKLLVAAEQDIRTIRKNQQDFTTEHGWLKQQKAELTTVLANWDDIIEREGKRPNPFTAHIASLDESLVKLRKQEPKLKAELEQIEQDHAAVSYWVSGFKKIRLMLIEETLRSLELEVNSTLSSLGLLEWRVEFDVERENKSGGVTKGFTVLVHAPGQTRPVKFEEWSGGEGQRLRLAGDLGLANLIMIRAGLTSTIEFYDEPSSHLSQEGLLDLVETLNDRALSSSKRIFLVDHTVIDYDAFAGRLVAVKDADGSHLTVA